MDYDTTIEYLAKELGVKDSQIKQSFGQAKALNRVDFRNSDFVLEEKCVKDYMDKCAGKIPQRIYHIQNGREKTMVTTSPVKKETSYVWK
tara:strand:+ start:21684 stop:21953 length:270 start_codon:yes stop_codon:yes gene_type:complete